MCSLTFSHRTSHQVVLLHRAQIDPGFGPQGGHALFGQLCQGQPPVRAGHASVQVRFGHRAAE